MKALPLIACLVLTPAARAQTAPSENSTAGQASFVSEIQAWRTRLPHVSPPAPLTEEFEPRLDKIETAVKAARKPSELDSPRKDFDAWRHEFVLKSYRLSRAQGLAGEPLTEYSQRQRAMMSAFARQREQVVAPVLAKTAAASGDGAHMFYDGNQRVGAPIMMPGSFGSPKVAAANAEPQGTHLRINDTPPPVTSAALSFSSLVDYIDSSRGGRVAHAVASKAVGFTHWCFAYVKDAFISAKDKLWAMIDSSSESGEIGIPPAVAAGYARAVNKNPQLLAKLGYRRVDVKTLPGNDPAVVPEGALFVFAPGCAGYSAGAGHIEIAAARGRLEEISRRARPALAADEVLTCSDGCHGRTLNYFRTYGGDRRSGRRVRPACMNMYVPVLDASPAPTQPRVSI